MKMSHLSELLPFRIHTSTFGLREFTGRVLYTLFGWCKSKREGKQRHSHEIECIIWKSRIIADAVIEWRRVRSKFLDQSRFIQSYRCRTMTVQTGDNIEPTIIIFFILLSLLTLWWVGNVGARVLNTKKKIYMERLWLAAFIARRKNLLSAPFTCHAGFMHFECVVMCIGLSLVDYCKASKHQCSHSQHIKLLIRNWTTWYQRIMSAEFRVYFCRNTMSSSRRRRRWRRRRRQHKLWLYYVFSASTYFRFRFLVANFPSIFLWIFD